MVIGAVQYLGHDAIILCLSVIFFYKTFVNYVLHGVVISLPLVGTLGLDPYRKW